MGAGSLALNIKDILDKSTEYLNSKGIESARLNAEWLLAHLLDKERIDLYLQFDRLLTESETADYRSLLKERVSGKPLQYIIGDVDFMGIKLMVDENVLIPRPETEQLVEIAIEKIKFYKGKTLKVLDIGTGSGNIAIALAKFVPSSVITAIDVSGSAIEVAKKNAENNGVTESIEFITADLRSDEFNRSKYDLVISNPPYIPIDTMSTLSAEVREWEPEVALTDYSDGLSLIREVIERSVDRLEEDGILLMEIGGNDQSELLKKMLSEAGFSDVKVENDYNSHARFVSGTLKLKIK